jgi:hypothetical protein
MMGERRLFVSGHLTEEGVCLYVDALKLKRSGELPVEILHHVTDCTQCKLHIAELEHLLAEVPYSNSQPHPFLDRSRIGRFGYRIAAAIALTLGVAALYYYYISSSGAPPPRTETAHQVAASIDSSAPLILHVGPPPDTLYAAEFEPSPNLEDLVGGNVRSSSAEIISPQVGGIVPPGNIRLEWKGGQDGTFQIVVLSNAEKIIRSVETAHRSCILSDSLIPGLYYWKIEQQGDLLGVGKFTVK